MILTQPLISIIVCCRNEKEYIENCLNSLLQQKKMDNNLEILVIDGMSTDGTRDIILTMQKKFQVIKFFDNPAKVKPQAINLGFKESKGEYLLICDAHAIYDENYLSTCLELIRDHNDAWCVGGPFTNVGETLFGKALAIAMNSPIGIGNAKHRYPDYEGYGEMVMFGMFPRSVLNTVGYYDEQFIINHDDEYCYRLRKAGGKVFISNRAKCYYFVRKNPKSLFIQYFNYGFWQIAFLKKHKIPISFRQLVPFTFFSLVVALLVTGLIINNLIISSFLIVLYTTVLVITSIPVLIKNGIKVALNFPLAVIVLHFSYAWGFFLGLFKFKRKKF
ncbi:MAG: glycosyltransferase family 2 protein [Ignavibacteriales bacterium]|nr:MAG: glycosyltransferase family 2 protein [Ignavibacteriales bacterium]